MTSSLSHSGRRARSGFTLVELLVATSVFALVTLGLFSFTSFAMRMVSRNFATNRSHEIVRISDLQLLRYLHESGSAFRLVAFDGTNYTDATPTATTDVDASTQKLVSTRANGVRFRRLGGGPYRLTANTAASSRNLSFNFGVGGTLPYVPQVGDKVALPLIAREFDISAVPTVPTAGSPVGVITIAEAGGIGFTIDATTSGNVTTAYFYRSTAFTVWGNRLRYHANFTGAQKTSFTTVRDNVTSPKPFALLYPSAGGATDGLSLRISLEAYDGDHSARQFTNGTATLQAVIPTRSIPPPIASTNSN